MENNEFDLCNKKCKSFLKRDKIGRLISNELQRCFERIFREGYKLGKEAK